MRRRFPYSFLQPSVGDRLLDAAQGVTLEILRTPEEIEVSFTLKGTLPPSSDVASVFAGVARVLTRPLPEAGHADGGVE